MDIKATIIADSITHDGVRITTFELEYPRFIHGELMTHRLFSRNAASSRAIPITKMQKQVWEDPAMPVEWGSNKSGMQAGDPVENPAFCKWAWKMCAKTAVISSKLLAKLGLHKQIVNRVLEPFQMMKTVLTATEYDNFFMLRDHEDAQPEIRELAKAMDHQMKYSIPVQLKAGEWHLPYIKSFDDGEGGRYYTSQGELISLSDARKVSSSCCAQVSYRILNQDLEKALSIYGKLVDSDPVHASPFEHQATPMSDEAELDDKGITHMDSQGNLWSGNLKGWIQYRQIFA